MDANSYLFVVKSAVENRLAIGDGRREKTYCDYENADKHKWVFECFGGRIYRNGENAPYKKENKFRFVMIPSMFCRVVRCLFVERKAISVSVSAVCNLSHNYLSNCVFSVYVSKVFIFLR